MKNRLKIKLEPDPYVNIVYYVICNVWPLYSAHYVVAEQSLPFLGRDDLSYFAYFYHRQHILVHSNESVSVFIRTKKLNIQPKMER